uniref:Phosphoinositide 3-kinase regulatory subunit 5 n=1 Tax=Periophthalmus magnuspinnatus TaxID=409849 RepID=A0A3B3ZA79_9GOBI
MEQAEQSSCTEDRIEHVLERCLCDLGLDTPNKQLWNAGLCINRWCLEELVKRNSQNSVILLNKILKKTKAVLERCEYELVVPLTLLFTSTLLKAPHVPADCGLLQEAYSLFHCFLSWPEPCSSACRRVLLTLQRELRAPGISFQRLVRTEHGVPSNSQSSKTMQSPTSAGSPQKHLCMRRRPILSCDLTEEPEQVVQVRVVVFGGDKELGRLARAYTDLQHTDSKQLTKRCKLRFYFVPTRRKNVETQAFAETANEGSTSVVRTQIINEFF